MKKLLTFLAALLVAVPAMAQTLPSPVFVPSWNNGGKLPLLTNNLSDIPSIVSARANLGLGALAILNAPPPPGVSTLGGIAALTCTTNQFVNGIDTEGNPTCATPTTGSSTAAAGSSGQFQTNSSGSLAGVTVAGDVAISGTTGVATIQPSTKFPSLSASVQGTGQGGLDGGSWFIWKNQTTVPNLSVQGDIYGLRVDRHAAYTSPGGNTGTYPAIWGVCSATANVTDYQWCGKFELDNNAAVAGGAQNVAINATATKHAGASPTWAANFVVQNNDGEADPVGPMIGNEFDIYANGSDIHSARHATQMVLGRPGNTGAAVHAASAMFVTPNSSSTFDHGLWFSSALGGNFGNVIDMTAATIVGNAFASPGFSVNAIGGVTATLPTSGTPAGTVCITSGGVLYVKTTAGACL